MRTLLLLAALPALAAAAEPATPPAGSNGVVEAQPIELSATQAAADGVAPAAAPATPAAAAAARAPGPRGAGAASLPRFGLVVEAGVPEGGAVSLVFRPYRAVRFAAGPAWNYLAWGAQGSLTFVPWQWAISPTIGIQGGRYFDADLRWLVKSGTGTPAELKPLLGAVGYSYAGAVLGLEMGSQRGFAFSLRFGLSYLWAQAKGSAQTTTSGGTTGATDAQVTLTNPRIRATIPTFQLGFQYFF